MTKHVLDRPKTVSTKVLARTLSVERQRRPHLATLTLQRRSRQRDVHRRAQFYAQIARAESS